MRFTDRIVAGLMLIVFAFLLIPDHVVMSSAEYDEIKTISDWRMSVGPGYVFLVAMVVGLFGTIVGGLTRISGWKRSRTVLAAGAVGIVLSYPGYETYTDTYLTAAADIIWAILMGWLIATPVPETESPKNPSMGRISAALTIVVIVAFGLSGWLIFGPRDTSFTSDLSIEIEIGELTIEAESKADLLVGRVTTVRIDGYIVDLVIASSTEQEAEIGLKIFESLNGARGAILSPCIDFSIPISETFGAAASCGKLLLVLSGRIDPSR